MYNRQLDTFLKVAELGSFSKAAEALYITPSAVIQQINNLEQSLQVNLFIRTKRGTHLTPAGEYLQQSGQTLIQLNEDILHHLHILSHERKPEIRIGTDLLMKCRLFYELWVRFCEDHENYQAKIVNIDKIIKDYKQVDFIEGIKDGELWQNNMDFLELCTVPIACAVPKTHELASKKLLSFKDMQGKTLITIRKGMSEILDQLGVAAENHGVQVIHIHHYDLSLFSMCIVNGYLLQTPFCWQDIHPNLVTIPCLWEYSLPYGLHYHKELPKPSTEFLEFVKELCKTEKFRLY